MISQNQWTLTYSRLSFSLSTTLLFLSTTYPIRKSTQRWRWTGVLPQAINAAASAIAFRQFVRNFFVQISPNCRVPQQAPAVGFSECAFQRLSNHEAGNVHKMSILPWVAWVVTVSATAGARTGTAYEMRLSPGGAAGDGRSPQCQHIRWPLFIVP